MSDPQTPVAETADVADTQESGSEPTARPALASFEDAIRAEAEGVSSPPQGTPAPTAEAEPARQGVRPESRRSAAARANAERIADLERQLAARDPEQLRAQVRAEWEAEQQSQASRAAQAAAAAQDAQAAEVYERLLAMPDHELTSEQYQWREERKALLRAFPSVEGHHKAVLERRQQDFLANQRAHLAEQLSALAERPGVDRAAFKDLPTFGQLGEHLYEAGKRSRDAEVEKLSARIRALEADGSQYRLSGPRGLGAHRQPAVARGGGRSSAGTPGRPDFRTSSASDIFDAAIRQSANGADA